jgi:hypothetical protein
MTADTFLLAGGSFFWLARKAYERSKSDPSESILTIILSAIAVESFINELTEFASNPSFTENEPSGIKVLGAILSDLEEQKSQIGAKIQLTYYILTRQQLKVGELPYQDFALLISIRNALVHKKPEKFHYLDSESSEPEFEPHKFIKSLSERKVIELPSKAEVPQWYAHIHNPEVARWSYNIAVQMIKLIIDIVPAGRFKNRLLSMTKTVEEIP